MPSLECFDQIFVAWFEEMFESSLFLQEFFYRKLLLRLVVQDPFALYDLKQRPVASLYTQLTDLHDIRCVISPSTRARCHDIQECCARRVDCFFRLDV